MPQMLHQNNQDANVTSSVGFRKRFDTACCLSSLALLLGGGSAKALLLSSAKC